MQVNDSVTRRARRDQIITSAIELVAEHGYEACTFQRIARAAGVSSTRMISYHFDGKGDLVSTMLARCYEAVGTFVAKRVTDHADAREALAGYIRTAVALNDTHRAEMRALTELVLHHRFEGAGEVYSSGRDDTAVGRVEAILREGVESGVLRSDLDCWVTAVTVQRSIDGIGFLLRSRPDMDLDSFADQLVRLFDLATRTE